MRANCTRKSTDGREVLLHCCTLLYHRYSMQPLTVSVCVLGKGVGRGGKLKRERERERELSLFCVIIFA